MSISPKSRKAKGREFQKDVRDKIREIGRKYDLHDEDVESRQMGGAGLDIVLTPAARELLGNLQIECKKQETLNVIGTFVKHAERYKDKPGFKILVHTRNSNAKKKIPALVTITIEDFLEMVGSILCKDFIIASYEDLHKKEAENGNEKSVQSGS